MISNNGDLSPDFDAQCCNGICGPIDEDFTLNKNKEQEDALDRNIDSEIAYGWLLESAERTIYNGQLSEAVRLYQEAYHLAWETPGLGIDACYAVMVHLQSFNFYEESIKLAEEITAQALKTRDIDLLRDMWRFLPTITTEKAIHERALNLRDDISLTYPEVMNAPTQSDPI